MQDTINYPSDDNDRLNFASQIESMNYKIPAQTRIGHVHLKVADLERALKFYRDLFGFEVSNTMATVPYLFRQVVIIIILG